MSACPPSRTDVTRPSQTQRDRLEEERALFARLARERTPDARNAIFERFMPLALQLARRYSHGRDVEDLEQVAAMGLVKAIDRFDTSRGLAFSSFAVPTIAGEVKRYLRDHAWSVRVPREVQETYIRIDRATEDLTTRLGRAPTAAELAEQHRRHGRGGAGGSAGGDRPAGRLARSTDTPATTSPTRSARSSASTNRASRPPSSPRCSARSERSHVSRTAHPAPALRGRPHADARSASSSGCLRCRSRACCAARSRSSRKPPTAERDTLGAIPVSGHALPSPPLALQP